MGRADRARRERPSRRLSFRSRRPAGPATPSSPSFVRRLPRAAAGLVVVFAALLALPLQAQAQTVTTLVSNTGQIFPPTSGFTVGTSSSNQWSHALGFTTGDNTDGYTLSSVEVGIRTGYGALDEARVSIYGADGSGNPGSSLYVLDNPASITNGDLNTFTAQANATLVKETKYFVVIESAAADQSFTASVVTSNAEDTGNADGWSINDKRHVRSSDSGSWSQTSSTSKPRIAIKGTVDGDTTHSTDATLSALALSGVTLSPAFVSTTETYTATVGNSVTATTVTATPTDSGATVAFKDGDDNALTNPVTLAVGDNVIRVKVTAEDSTTTETYEVTVTREAATTVCTVDLGGRTEIWSAEMTVGEEWAGPPIGDPTHNGFYAGSSVGALSDDEYDFGSMTGVEIQRITVSITGSLVFETSVNAPTADDPALRLHACGDAFDLGDATTSSFNYLWQNTGLDWSDVDKVQLALSASSDATLSALTLDGTPVPGFGPDTLDYAVTVPAGTTRVTVEPTENERGALVAFLDADDAALDDADDATAGHQVDLEAGANVIKVQVTPGDRGTTTTYTLTVTRQGTSTCPAPNLAGRTQIWTGDVTVGLLGTVGTPLAYGFGADFGALDNTQFSFGPNGFTVDFAAVDATTTLAIAGRLRFSLTGAQGATDLTQLTLHVCGDSFALADATVDRTIHTYSWDSAGLDWSSATSRTLYLSVLGNSPATGTPTITGTLRVGATLTASTANISDHNGKPSVFEYRWFRVDGSNRTGVGADQSTYTVTDADVGSQIQVDVTFTDDAGNEEGPLRSARTDIVTATTAPPPPTGQSDKQLIGTSPSSCHSCPDENVTATKILAQEFSTGSDKGGYRVRSLWVYTSGKTINSGSTDFSLWSADSNGDPGTRMFGWDFDRWRSGQAHGFLFLTAPDDPAAKLDPNTTYFIVAKANGNNTIEIRTSRNRDRLQGGGWNIEGRHLESSDSGSTWSSHGKPITFRLRGIVRLSPVRLGALTVTGTQIDPTLKGYTYEGEIPFGTSTVTIDAQPGDTTSTLEYLFPDGSIVPDDTTQSGLQVSPITDRTRVNIKITSADNVLSETYKVRLRRMGNPVQAPATGEVVVTGDPAVNSTLEASVRNFNEPNGTFFAEGGRPWYGPDFIRSNYGFHFVWYADRSTSGNTVYIVGQGRRLELTQNMLGRRISVKYAFTDDLDNYEALYSAETGAVQAQPGTSTATTATDEEGAAPLTARFAAMPAEHDGESRFRFRLVFSDEIFDGAEPLNKNKAVRDALAVTGGAATGSRRVDKTEFDEYWIDVRPSGNGPVTISLSPAASCGASSVTCTPDGRKLTTPISTRVEGPPGLSVADANVLEGPGAALAFAVTLDRPTSAAVQVDYATRDGSAQAGSDYTASSGTLRFAPGETANTVTVAVLDDSHDEGSETLKLVLSNPSGAYLADGEATGTIENTDHMPKAWLARFGRTVAEQVLDAVGPRVEGNSNSPGPAQLTLGGHRVALDASWYRAEDALLGEAGVFGQDLRERRDLLRAEADASPAREISTAGFLMASSFHMASAGGEGKDESGRWSLWARGSRSSFSGREDALTLEGDVSTGVMGADYERGGVLAGVAIAYSAGEGSYTEADARGEVESTLLSAYPYLRYALSERLSVWGVLGLGEGGLTLDVERNDERIETDISLAMAAFGARGKLLSVAGYDLAVKTDVLFVRTESEAAAGLAAADARTRRLRLTLEGSREVKFESGVLTPFLEVGLRHDGGDAETGSGLELGGGLRWAGLKGFSVEVRARGLLAHEERDYEEWGVSASLGLSPGEGDRGLSMRVGSAWGAASGGVERIWSQRALSGSGFDPDARLDVEVGYGLDAPRGLLTPYTGVALSESGEVWRAGARWKLGPAFEVNIEATLRDAAGGENPEGGVLLRGSRRW